MQNGVCLHPKSGAESSRAPHMAICLYCATYHQSVHPGKYVRCMTFVLVRLPIANQYREGCTELFRRYVEWYNCTLKIGEWADYNIMHIDYRASCYVTYYI